MKNTKKVRDRLGRGRFCSNYTYAMLSIAGILSFLVVWELLISMGLVSGRYLAKPTELVVLFVKKFYEASPDGSLLPQSIGASLQVSLAGLCFAILVGVPLGLCMGWFKALDGLVNPVFEVIRPIPPISWIPLTVLWLGIGLRAKAFIIFFSALIPCVINSYTGIKQTNKTLIDVARTCGASNVETFLKVGIPSAMPMTFSGVRVAVGNAWSTLVAAEMLASSAGLGYMILMGRMFARPDIILLGMIVIGAIGALFNGILTFVENRVIRWR